ncbi:hypothetical protein IWW36_002912 [Coemansia brasiliensis]|uniref:Uncharacterized protein n=1 Tax=Coemansia brasiliensis TaxID=2650707 RepID=A0A9W8ICL9_9FUNG|nr:hypothetical protein IWW36_002912 [Coemansia brasiliensis]
MTTTRRNFMDEDEPPAYTELPGAQEESLDAGAGAPIVRTRPPHLVVNPSDPRSMFSRNYHANSLNNSSSTSPRRSGAAIPGPVPMSPRLPPRRQAGYEQMETALHSSPRTYTSLPHIRHTNTHSYPLDHIYSSLRNNQNTVRVVNGVSPSLGSRWHSAGGSSSVIQTAFCSRCQNTGWLFYKVPCSCPVGKAVKSSHPRFHSSLLGFIDDLLGPVQQPYPSYINTDPSLSGPSGRREAPYLQYVPGPGSPCPNCMGQSYFRNSDARNTPAGRDVRGRLGRTPPPCNVCVDRGRISL